MEDNIIDGGVTDIAEGLDDFSGMDDFFQTLDPEYIETDQDVEEETTPSPNTTAVEQLPTVEGTKGDDTVLLTVQEYNELVDYINSDEFNNAVLIANEFGTDPKGFIEKYLPEVASEFAQQIQPNLGMESNDYATNYAEVKLANKYGADFKIDPYDAQFPETDSGKYMTDRQNFLLEGMRVYQEKQAELQINQDRQRYEAERQSIRAFTDLGFEESDYARVMEVANSIPNTPENYFEMLFTYLAVTNRIAHLGYEVENENTSTRKGPQRRSPSLPPPSITQGSGGNSAGSNVTDEMRELFQF